MTARSVPLTARSVPPIQLPLLLAGPVLRRAEPGRVCVWAATGAPARVAVEVGRPVAGGLAVLGRGDARQVRMGPALYVHLAIATPTAGPPAATAFPVGELLAYDLSVSPESGPTLDLGGLGLLEGPTSLAYPGLVRPTFFLAPAEAPLHLLHGSCRQLHGAGADAFLAADGVLGETARDLARRPSALFLTGDQIYGDEVGGPLARHLARLGRELLGPRDDTSVPGVPALSSLPTYGRQRLADAAGFTSTKAENHLFSLGEYAAAYLVAWNEAVWPTSWPPFDEAVPEEATPTWRARRSRRRQYAAEASRLEEARRALPAVRRVLANVPTYTCFDDHDVTDDWNLTRAWRDRAHHSPTGRRVIANALGAFWAFQGWGNDPDAYDEAFIAAVSRDPAASAGLDTTTRSDATAGRPAEMAAPRPANPVAETPAEGAATTAASPVDATAASATATVTTVAPATADPGSLDRAFEHALWSFDRWSYVAPTSPPTLVLDTRTQRAYDSDEGAARLIGAAGLERVRQLAVAAGVPAAGRAVIVSAVPVFGLELQERRQKFLAGKLGPYEIDFENWHAALQGLVDLMTLLIDDLRLRRGVILSGDVHYGLTVDARFQLDGRELRLAQLVSSAIKHSGLAARGGLDVLGRLVRPEHGRVGWDEPPDFARSPSLLRRLLHRPANTDEWTNGGPLFLPPALAERVDPDIPPRYRESRRYVRPEERGRSVLVGESNVGLVTLTATEVVHVVLGQLRGQHIPHTTRVDLSDDLPG